MSMAKVSNADEHHREVPFVGSGNDIRVAHRAAGLNGRGRTGFGGGDQSIGKREKSVAANHAVFEREPRFSRFPYRYAADVHAAHLACTYSECTVCGGEHDRIGS